MDFGTAFQKYCARTGQCDGSRDGGGGGNGNGGGGTGTGGGGAGGGTGGSLSGARLETFAGGNFGDDKPAADAVLTNSSSLAVHPMTGLTYFPEPTRHRVMSIDGNGILRRVAGTGQCGYSGDGQVATLAQLCAPQAIAFGDDGTLYIADTMNARIRAVDWFGVISTVAGNGNCLEVGAFTSEGPFAQMSIGRPHRLAHSPSAKALYVASSICGDPATDWVLKVWPASKDVFVLAGNRNASCVVIDGALPTACPLPGISGLAVDAKSWIYFAQKTPGTVRRFADFGGTSAGGPIETISSVKTVLGGNCEDAGISGTPADVALLGGTELAVSTSVGGRLFRLSQPDAGKVCWTSSTIAGGFRLGIVNLGSDAGLNVTLGAMGGVGAKSGTRSVVFQTVAAWASGPNTIQRLALDTGVVEHVAGGLPMFFDAGLEMALPEVSGITVDRAGGVLLSVAGLNSIWKLDSGGARRIAGSGAHGLPTQLRGFVALTAALGRPGHLAAGASSSVYFVDPEGSRAFRLDDAGVLTTVAGRVSSLGASTICNDDGGFRLYIDGGSIIPLDAGSDYNCFGDTSYATSAVLVEPSGIAYSNGGVFLSEGSSGLAPDRGNRVRRIDLSTSTITTVAGGTSFTQSNAGYAGDEELGTKALLNNPTSLSVTPDGGALLISDTSNRRLRKLDLTSGVITTIAGRGTAFPSSSAGNGGRAIDADFITVGPAAVDPDTFDIYVVDPGAANLRKISPDGLIDAVAGPQACDEKTCASGFAGDGLAPSAALFSRPGQIAFLPGVGLLVVDTNNERVRLIRLK
jgi:sugar lactone lactonase YvrE